MQKNNAQKKQGNLNRIFGRFTTPKPIIYFFVFTIIIFAINWILYQNNNKEVGSLHGLLGFQLPISTGFLLILILTMFDWIKSSINKAVSLFVDNNQIKIKIDTLMDAVLKWLIILLFLMLGIILGNAAFVIYAFYSSDIPLLICAFIILCFVRVYFVKKETKQNKQIGR